MSNNKNKMKEILKTNDDVDGGSLVWLTGTIFLFFSFTIESISVYVCMEHRLSSFLGTVDIILGSLLRISHSGIIIIGCCLVKMWTKERIITIY